MSPTPLSRLPSWALMSAGPGVQLLALLGIRMSCPGACLPRTLAEISQSHATTEISFIATDAQNK